MTSSTRASDSVWHVQHLHAEGPCRQESNTCARSNATTRLLHPHNTPVKTADVFIYSIFNSAMKPKSLLVSSGLIVSQFILDGHERRQKEVFIVQHQEENYCDKQKPFFTPLQKRTFSIKKDASVRL